MRWERIGFGASVCVVCAVAFWPADAALPPREEVLVQELVGSGVYTIELPAECVTVGVISAIRWFKDGQYNASTEEEPSFLAMMLYLVQAMVPCLARHGLI